MVDKGHWKYGEVPDPSKYLGFIYLITHVGTGKMYLGKKQYWYIRQPRKKGCKSVISDISSPKFKQVCWKESPWREYTGSSKDFNKFIKEEGKDAFTFNILKQCTCKSHLHYSEIEEMVYRGVLWKTQEDGTPLYFNRQISACRFRIKDYTGKEV